MRKRLPPLNPLRAFEASARYLSVSRAANELNVTPGAVSHQIRALEEALKATLFRRDGGRLRLTPQGSSLLPAVTTAFDSIAEASALLTRPTTEGDLVVSCAPALTSFWLIPHLGSFAKRYPGIRLKLIASADDRDISSQDIDLCIRYGNGAWPDRHVELWTQLVLFPVCSPTLVNAKPLREVSDLASHILLQGDDGREWQNWLSAAGAPALAAYRHYNMSDVHLAIETAIHGHGVALGDSISTSRLLAEGSLIMPFTLEVPAPAALYIVCRSELRKAPIVQAFIDWMTAQIKEEKTVNSRRSRKAKRFARKTA